MIKEFFLNNSMSLIEGMHKYNNDQLDEIRYGLEGIYMTLTKVIIILILSLVFNIFKEAILFLLIFDFLCPIFLILWLFLIRILFSQYLSFSFEILHKGFLRSS